MFQKLVYVVHESLREHTQIVTLHVQNLVNFTNVLIIF